jgi:hypothetical protein
VSGALRVALALALAVAAIAPAAAEFRNAQPTALGTVWMPPYLQGRGPVEVEARIRLADPAALPQDGHLLVGFSTRDPMAHVRLDAVRRADGGPLRAASTDSDRPDQPRRAIAVADIGPAGEILLQGTAWADGNGRFHVGALAMAFTADWGPVVDASGQPAQAYGFTWLGARQLNGVAGPFTGQGNDPVALIPAVALVATCAFLWWLSRRPARMPRFQRSALAPRPVLVAPPLAREPRLHRPAPPRPTWRPPPRPAGIHPVRPAPVMAARAPHGRPARPAPPRGAPTPARPPPPAAQARPTPAARWRTGR